MAVPKHVVAIWLVLAAVLITSTLAEEAVHADAEAEPPVEKTNTKNVQQELLFGVITPQCFHAFVSDHDFFNIPCLKMVISKLLGYAIITGSFVLKLPQILKIAAAKDATGLTPTSFYMEVVLFVSSTAYNVLRGYPISAWGENGVVLVQNIILVLLLWAYRKPKVPVQTRLLLVLAFFALAGGMLLTPPKYQWILASMGIPVSIAARIPQVVNNFKQGHTGQLALITLVLNFGGSAARLFTTLQETGDFVQTIGFCVSIMLNGTLVLQVLLFWKATNKVLAKRVGKKSE